jgi:tetratricopeptide (TPR) repeat protein
LEPLSPVVMHGAAMNSIASRRYGESIERALKGLEVDPEHFLLRHWLGLSYQMEGRYAEAIQEMERAVDICRSGVSWVVGSLAGAYAAAGNRAEALRLLEELLSRAKRETIDFTSVAVVYAILGDLENALTSLEKACDARGMAVCWQISIRGWTCCIPSRDINRS